jgi:hypothetical protein
MCAGTLKGWLALQWVERIMRKIDGVWPGDSSVEFRENRFIMAIRLPT